MWKSTNRKTVLNAHDAIITTTRKKSDMTNNEILAYKSFDKDFKCRGYQYSVGEWFKHDGAVEVGASGFHAYINPLDLLGYCLLLDNKFAVVKCSGDVRFEEGGDSKIACSDIFIEEEIDFTRLINKGVDWFLHNINYSLDLVNTKNLSKIVNKKDYSSAVSVGCSSFLVSTGYSSASVNTGRFSTTVSQKNYSSTVSTGYSTVSVCLGYSSVSVNTGNFSKAAVTGNCSASISSGNSSYSVCFGNRSASVSVGNFSRALATGDSSVAVSTGIDSKSKAGIGGAIVCVYRDSEDGSIIHIKASKVGENGIKPDTWYTLDANGDFMEVK